MYRRRVFNQNLDERVIAAARDGFYTINDAADISPERLRRFFSKEADGYRVRRELRELILFASHNALKDPPFSRLDLASCRNILIYLNRAAQERVMETFHFALNTGGYLFLGNSETTDGAGDLYAPVSREHHVFQSRQIAERIAYPVPDASSKTFAFGRTQDSPLRPSPEPETETPHFKRISLSSLHLRLLEQYAPSIVINADYEIVHISESAVRYLRMKAGAPTQNLLDLIRQELRLELRTALYQAVQRQVNVEVKNLKINFDGRDEIINLAVRPVFQGAASTGNDENGDEQKIPDDFSATGFILVLFEAERSGDDAESGRSVYTSAEPVASQLEEELMRSKSQLRAAVEQYEIQAEELKASNEELQAMNEEMRSAAEELETGKEELQSVNEELVTVNQELKIKIEELGLSNNDFQNLINSTDIATIFLDRLFRVNSFTPASTRIFNLIAADTGRPLSDITHRLERKNLLDDAETVLDTLQSIEREVVSTDKRVYLMRVLPYRTAEDRINGIVITFTDITERKRAEEARHYLASVVESSEDSIITVDLYGIITSWNRAAEKLYGYPWREAAGKPLTMLTLPEDLAEVLSNAEKIEQNRKVEIYETVHIRKDGREMNLEIVLSPIKDDRENIIGVSTIARDVTKRRQAEKALQANERRLRQMVNVPRVGVLTFNYEGVMLHANDAFLDMIGFDRAEFAAKIHTWREFTPPEYMKASERIFEQLRETGRGGPYEKEYFRRDGSRIWFMFVAADLGDGTIVEYAVDITERKLIEEALRESDERLRLLIESASDFAIFTLTHDGLIDTWNTGAEKIFGWTETEVIGQPGDIIFTPEDRTKNIMEKEMKTALQTGRAPDERFHMRKNGTRFSASGVMSLLRDAAGNVRGFVKIARDMTERIAAEKALRDKEMLQKLVGAQEDERKRIARDLHDELGQQLTALRLKLDIARKKCDDDDICRAIEEMEQLARSIDNGVDFLAWELRPAALDQFGLVAALENYVRQWSHHSGVSAEILASSLKRNRFAPEVETNLYRIVQEALNNIHKHAQAKNVELALEKRNDLIVLIIQDNGSGFNPKNKKERLKGIGLIGMRERAVLIGGTLEIESAPGAGTTVFVRVPALTIKKGESDGK